MFVLENLLHHVFEVCALVFPSLLLGCAQQRGQLTTLHCIKHGIAQCLPPFFNRHIDKCNPVVKGKHNAGIANAVGNAANDLSVAPLLFEVFLVELEAVHHWSLNDAHERLAALSCHFTFGNFPVLDYVHPCLQGQYHNTFVELKHRPLYRALTLSTFVCKLLPCTRQWHDPAQFVAPAKIGHGFAIMNCLLRMFVDRTERMDSLLIHPHQNTVTHQTSVIQSIVHAVFELIKLFASEDVAPLDLDLILNRAKFFEVLEPSRVGSPCRVQAKLLASFLCLQIFEHHVLPLSKCHLDKVTREHVEKGTAFFAHFEP
mmetsp:Transcript_1403/g.2277  ORF Transcript_1403/g.2277 Transcript_1403/m.2277 type:complete len:315 (-) Transcript_1403:831-1775(-)